MKRKGIKEFILRVLLAASPLALFLALYVVLDPFGVVHRYDGVSVESGDSLERIPNKRYVAVEGLKYHSLERHYDSFIFGSSLSTNFTARQWVRHLPDSAHIYHFTAGAPGRQACAAGDGGGDVQASQALPRDALCPPL